MKCRVCGAQEGTRVLRFKDPSKWRYWWPAQLLAVPGDKKYEYLHRRENSATNFAVKSALFIRDPKLGALIGHPVNLNELYECTWCTAHLKTDRAPPVCPRCVPKPPPRDPVPCPLCAGEGVLRGARSMSDVVDRIVLQVKTNY